MERERLKRYKDKIHVINIRKGEVEVWREGFFNDSKTKLASYKAFQEIAEGILDISAMLVKDAKTLPADDYTNADKLVQLKIIDQSLLGALKDINGLRNRIIHEYNGFDEKTAQESMHRLLPKVADIIKGVEQWISKH